MEKQVSVFDLLSIPETPTLRKAECEDGRPYWSMCIDIYQRGLFDERLKEIVCYPFRFKWKQLTETCRTWDSIDTGLVCIGGTGAPEVIWGRKPTETDMRMYLEKYLRKRGYWEEAQNVPIRMTKEAKEDPKTYAD